MNRLRIGSDIDAPAQIVWDLLTDTWQWPVWGPSILSVDSPDRHVRSGSRGRVRTVVGVWLPYEVTHVVPGRSWDWRVAGVPSTGHEVHAIAADRCRVVFTIPWLAAPYAAVVKLALGRLADSAAAAVGPTRRPPEPL